MTHIRQEITFRSISTISQLFGIQDLPLGSFARRDVVPDSYNSIDDTLFINKRHFGGQ